MENLEKQRLKIDILVNNAGIYFKEKKGYSDELIIKNTLSVNYYGTVNFTKILLPFLTPDAKILMMGSNLGTF